MRRSPIALVIATMLSAWAATASAQDLLAPAASAPEAPAAHVSRPPQLLEFIETAHPVGREADASAVLLSVVVGIDGSVESAEVVESGGADFDAAALDAVRRFRFEPATIDGVPTRARIRYRYVFTVTAVPTPPAPEAPDVDAASEPAAEGDAAAAPSPEPEAVHAELTDAEIPTFSAEGVVEPPPRDAITRRIEGDALTQMAGTRGDALRAVELMPGVGRPAFGLGVLIVRGAAPQDSQIMLGGSPVPLAYHFGGITSFYQSRLLDGITFMPGNFSVRYGRAVGGILEVDPRDPRTDRPHGFIDVNVIDASAMIEGAIGPHLSIAMAVRRSYIDAILSALNIPGLGVAPAYYDYQATVAWNPDSSNRVRLLMYGSDDQLVTVSSAPANATANASFGLDNQFHRVQLQWRHLYGEDVQHDISASLGFDLNQTGAGVQFRQDRTQWPIVVRSEWRARLAEGFHLVAGLDLQVTPFHLDIVTQSQSGPTQTTARATDLHLHRDDPIFRPAIYAEGQITIAEILDVVLGTRLDLYTEIGQATLSPRVTSRLRVSDQFSIRAGVGLFSQPPDIGQLLQASASSILGPAWAVHTDLGIDIRFPTEHLSFQLDGFYKHLIDRVVAAGPAGGGAFGGALGMELASATGLSFTGPNTRYANTGLGRIYGLEVAARLEPGGPIPLIGFLSYTLMRSEWLDHPGEDWHLSPFDQTHIFTLALSWQIGSGFELAATLRLVSGNPYTPVTGSVADLGSGAYQPIYGAAYSARSPLFNRLDVRFQKRFSIGDVGIVLYIDIQNVYNQANQEGVSYNYDYTQSNPIPSLPIIPSLGLRGEL